MANEKPAGYHPQKQRGKARGNQKQKPMTVDQAVMALFYAYRNKKMSWNKFQMCIRSLVADEQAKDEANLQGQIGLRVIEKELYLSLD